MIGSPFRPLPLQDSLQTILFRTAPLMHHHSGHTSGAIRNLLFNLVRRDLTVRYKSTVLGFFWSFIKPLAMTGIFYVVFQHIILAEILRPADLNIPLALHILTGILAWNFFAGACAESLNVIFANANLIKKVRLPLLVFPAAAVISHMIHFLLALIVLVTLLMFAGLPPGPAYLFFPFLLVLHFILTFAVATILSALNVFYRDVASVWEVLTQAWFYATPIIYPAYLVTQVIAGREWPGWAWTLYSLNPLTPIVIGYRHIFIYASAPSAAPEVGSLWLMLGLCFGVSLALLGIALKIFEKFSRSFADEL